MATIDNWDLIQRIIAANGEPVDGYGHRVVKIVSYINAWGRQTWGVVREGQRDPDAYDHPTRYINFPTVIFRRKEPA